MSRIITGSQCLVGVGQQEQPPIVGDFEPGSMLPTRRSFILSAAAAPALLTGQMSSAQDLQTALPQGFWNQPRSVWMKRQMTGEEIRATYWADGQLIQPEYKRLCWFMRDLHMENRIRRMQGRGEAIPPILYCAVHVSTLLLDILYATNGWLVFHNLARPLVLNNAFRHRITNGETEGAAKDSLHIVGGAGDISIQGVSASAVSAYGRWLSGGGVGWYPGKSFTHVDAGKLRSWKG